MEAHISFSYQPWNNLLEPNEGNVRQWLDNLWNKFNPLEQARWNRANIASLFYAGNQEYINRYFGFSTPQQTHNFYFNLLQVPVQMITGYQRQHRKNFNYIPSQGADPKTTDQYNRIITGECNRNGIHEQFSRACEQACVTGMVLLQPYLDYSGDDAAQGELKLKVWEYNSFLIDPFFRNADASDASAIWCQEYISKQEAEVRFPGKLKNISTVSGSPRGYGSFYFLPESHFADRNNLMVLSYVWYKWKKKKKRLYSRTKNQFFDFSGGEENLELILKTIPDLESVEIELPCWKLATILNDQLMYQGENPLGFDSGCPLIPIYWNYDPHISYPDLRCRGLVHSMMSSNYLLNRRIILNHDISEATINAGWKRKIGAIANEDNLKKSGQGWDLIINDGYEMTDVDKIIPSAVPESDMALAEQLQALIFSTSGVNIENWSAQDQAQASSLTVMLKQAANLMVLQKYFDQWDLSLKILGERLLDIVLNNWNAEKVAMLINEEPSPHFYSKVFAKFQTTVEEGLLTPTQQNLQAQQMIDMNQMFGREVFPPSMIIPKMNIAEKSDVIQFLQQQEQQMAAVQEQTTNIQHAFEETKLKETMSKALANIARAREDHSRSESNLGLYEERLSMIERNRAMSLKEKQAALTSLLENVQKYGEIETSYQENKLKIDEHSIRTEEELEKMDVERRTEANKFLEQILGGMQQSQQRQQREQVG